MGGSTTNEEAGLIAGLFLHSLNNNIERSVRL